MAADTLLQIKGLSVDFVTENGITHALNQVSLEVGQGELVAVVGESGSGKSVTSLSILQLLASPPAVYTDGQILFNAESKSEPIDLLKTDASAMRKIRGKKIAMIFQEPMSSLNPLFTCGEQVIETICLHEQVNREEATRRAIGLFEKVKLPHPAAMIHRYPHQLSGGQKQRVMIAMAISCGPSLLIADEPTTALDVTVQQTILELLKELQAASGMGILFITHDLGVVHKIADRVVVMYRGKILEEKSTALLFTNPEHPYTKALLACRPALYKKGDRLPVVSDFWMSGEPEAKSSVQEVIIKQRQESIPDRDKTSLLSVKNLQVWFPSRKNFFGKILESNRAVDGLSLEVFKGETLGLVGESGCGKTTLGRAMIGLIKPTAGSIWYKGKELSTYAAREMPAMRKDMQLIFQDPYSSLNPSISVGEAIMEPLEVHNIFSNRKQRKERVMHLLEKVNLNPEHFNRYPHEFSGGQRQRLVIARALALNPSFIVCDESVSALDVSVQAQVLNLLNDLKEEFKFTAVFISHDLSVVRYISDRIIVMKAGKIEETGSAEQIYKYPVSAYTRTLINAIPIVPAQSIPGGS